jgi:hypothetical protein
VIGSKKIFEILINGEAEVSLFCFEIFIHQNPLSGGCPHPTFVKIKKPVIYCFTVIRRHVFWSPDQWHQ